MIGEGGKATYKMERQEGKSGVGKIKTVWGPRKGVLESGTKRREKTLVKGREREKRPKHLGPKKMKVLMVKKKKSGQRRGQTGRD